MHTPNEAGVGGENGSPRDNESPGSAVWMWLEGLAGGLIAAGGLLIALPVLADLTDPLGLLSSTVVTFVAIVAWILVWGLVGTVRGRVKGAFN